MTRSLTDDPQPGDSATRKGQRYTVMEVRHHLNGDPSWIRVQSDSSGRVRSICHAEWCGLDGWRDHRGRLTTAPAIR